MNFNGISVTLHIPVFDAAEKILVRHNFTLFQQPFIDRCEIALVVGFCKLKYGIYDPLKLNDEVIA